MSGTQQQPDSISLRIAANFTVEPIEEFLSYWMAQLGIAAEIRFAPYNQVFQQLLEGGLLRSNRGGLNIVALDLDAWLVEGPKEVAQAQLERTISDLLALLRASASEGAGGAVMIFPVQTNQPEQRAAAIASAKDAILSQVAGMGWVALDLAAAVARYSVVEVRDPFTDELGNIPFTEEMYAAAATMAARWIRAVSTKARKLIVLDCDNTLWKGVYGEGSMQVTAAHRGLHEFMLRQRDSGMLLAIASKNNEEDVMAALEADDCLLRGEHFTAWQINWKPKSENLKNLAEDLGLALSSFVFLDDSPLECMEVRNHCPDVLTIQLPSDEQAIPEFLEHLWVFDRMTATSEDRARAGMYAAERQRKELSRRALTVDEFLASLQIQTTIAPITDSDLPRVAQLTHRTTQFNLTNVLHTEQTLAARLAAGSECLTVRVRDIFGDYGLVGVVMFARSGDSLRVEEFLLSCRALGRRIEDQMIEALKRRSSELGVEKIAIPVRPTARNRPALEFLAGLCNISVECDQPFEWTLSATGAAAEWRPIHNEASSPAPVSEAAAAVAVMSEEDLMLRIATELNSAEAIIASTRNQKKRRPATAAALVAPRTQMETKLAEIWSDGLSIEPIGINDNFFDFGGRSLIAARILARVRSEFGVELTLSQLFKTPTIEAMAAEIAAAQFLLAAAAQA